MAWNGAGVFNRLFSWTADKAAAINITASRMDSDTNDIVTQGLGNCITRDGQGQPTANLPMATFRHTGVANGVARTDYAAMGQLEDGTVNWAAAGGTGDVITATYSPAITVLVDGQLCFFRAGAANTTTTPTFSPNGLTARTITKIGGSALAAGDIPAANAEMILRYKLASTGWELLNPATLASATISSTDSGAGVGPTLDLFRDSSSPAASDFVGSLDFNGRNSAAAKKLYARVTSYITDTTSTTEDANLVLQAIVAGALTTIAQSSGAAFATAGTVTPQGYLTPTTGLPVIAADVIAATSVFYTPFVGNVIPIYDGTFMAQQVFSELTLTLASQHILNSIYDVFVFLDPATAAVTIGTGPAWSTITAGSGARGTGAGTTQLGRLKGQLVNVVSMTVRNGATTYAVAANQGTYVGSLYIDGTAGQVTCHKSYGQSRKWGVWNAYNRQPIELLMGDATGAWNYVTNTIRQSRADATNVLTTFTGLPEETVDIAFRQKVLGGTGSAASNSNVIWEIGIGVNVTNAYISGGKVGAAGGAVVVSAGTTCLNLTADSIAYHALAPTIGINNINALERATSVVGTTVTVNYQGGAANMMFNANWRG